MIFRRTKKILRSHDLEADEILLDVHNAPAFDTHQLEGRVVAPISKRTLRAFSITVTALFVFFVLRLMYLQISQHSMYATRSQQNSLDHIPVLADRGIIYDRSGTELAWNTVDPETGEARRAYIPTPGFAAVLGYVSYPAKDTSGNFYQTAIIGKAGVEKDFDTTLTGINGVNLVEKDVGHEILSQSVFNAPVAGQNLSLAIDAGIQSVLYKGITDLMTSADFKGGAGLVMDIHTGELRAITSAPEFDPAILSLGKDTEQIHRYLTDSARPFLNRALDGLYTPGSIVKPFFAMAALTEHIVTPSTIIVSTGQISIPNPYNKNSVTVFKDNAAHGPVNIEQALAVSSNIYFYEIGGGFKNQPGLGIDKLGSYAERFGIGEKTGVNLSGEIEGNVPSIAWKAKRFPGDPWRIGDTYNTSIGQYGFQVTPIQMVRAVAAVASDGVLVTPTITSGGTPQTINLNLARADFDVVKAGMRLSTTSGTTTALNIPELHVAAKSGTAQIKNNTRVNSWVIGFFPYENPKYAFAVLMENGPKVTTSAVHAFRPVIDYFVAHPELL